MLVTWSGIDEPNKHSFAVYGRNLSLGREVLHRPDNQVEAASTIKILILVYLLRQVQEGVLSLDKKLEVKQADLKDGGSGMMQCWMPRWPVEISQLCLAMMGTSDNVAANTLLRLLGMQQVNEYAQRIGLRHTRLLMSPIDPDKKKKKGEERFRIGETTAIDMGTLLVRLLRNELLQPNYTQLALATLEAVQQSYITRGIDTRRLQRWGSKTGTLYQPLDWVVLNECGFAIDRRSGDKVVLCVFSQQPNPGPLPYSQDALPRQKMVQVMAGLYQALL